MEEADRFSVFDSDGTPCGLFTVEVVCRAFFYGNLTSEALEYIMQKPQEFSARLQKSPRFHTSEAIRLLERDLALDTVEEAGAMAWLIGLKEWSVPDSRFRVPARCLRPDNLPQNRVSQPCLSAAE